MKKFIALAALLAVVGCTGSGEPTNVAEGVEMSDVEKYRQMSEESMRAEGEAAEASTKAKPGA